MIRVALIAGTFTAVLGLLVIARLPGAQHTVAQSPAPLSLEQEIKRVEAEIDKIFADTLTQLPSIPDNTANRMKRVQTLGKLELFDKQLSVTVAIRPSETAELHLCAVLSCSSVQQDAGRFLWRELLGSAVHWRQVAESRGGASARPANRSQ